MYKGAVLFMEAAMIEPETQICGASVIFDMDGLSLQQTMQFTPPFAKRIVDWLQVILLIINISSKSGNLFYFYFLGKYFCPV